MLIRSLFLAALTVAAASAATDARLANAAMQDDVDAVHALIAQKADVNAAQGDGMTALHWAALKDDLDIAKMLLAAGANVKATTRIESLTPLHMACTDGSASMIEALLKAGADPNESTSNGTTALMTAATAGNPDAVKMLLDHGADVNAKENSHGETALMFAAAGDRAAVVRLLAARGADLKVTAGVTSLEKPKYDENGNLIQERGRGGRAGAPGGEPQSPQAAAAAMGRRAAATKMGGLTALLFATREGHMETVKALVESGADVNQVSAADQTTPIVMAITNGHYEVGKYLLDHGADPNLANEDGLAALYATIDCQWAPVSWAPNPITVQEKLTYLDLMKALIDKGANVNARITKKLWFRPTSHDQMWIGTAGSTPFWRAAQANDITAMKLLIAHGADPKIATYEGVTPLMVAAGLGWAGNFSTNAPGTTPLEAVKYCVELGLDINAPQDIVGGYTALMGAAYIGNNELVEYLVKSGAKLDPHNKRGWSVTDMANGPSLRSSVPLKHPETVALLEKLGAPKLSTVEGEEILGIIKRKINTDDKASGTKTSETVPNPSSTAPRQ